MLKSSDGHTFIEIFDGQANAPREGLAAAEGEEIRTGALLHLAMSVENAKTAYNRCLEAGATSCIEPMELSLGNPAVIVNNSLVYSPNGEVIEFIEGAPF